MQRLIRTTKKIEDPRRQWGNLRHKLVDILVIAFCTILCGAQTYEDLELFGKSPRNMAFLVLGAAEFYTKRGYVSTGV